MFDTMTITKAGGALCGSLLVFLLGAWAAEELYHVGGHGDHSEQAYSIETGEGEVEEVVEEVPFDVVFTSADASRGERVFRRCSACHQLEDGANGAGPNLYGVVNREVGVADFGYSGALTEVAEVWTPENLNGFLERPSGWAPGTSMGFAGLPDVEDRANLIAYLATIGG